MEVHPIKVCVVGHGPSLKNACLGKEIDKFNVVVRLKKCGELLKNKSDYGTKTDYICSSTEVFANTTKITDVNEIWGYPKRNKWSKANEDKVKESGVNYRIFQDLCEKWNIYFRKIRSDAKYTNYSTGMAAIIITLDTLRPEKLILAGFDTTLDPSLPYTSTVSKSNYNSQTGHDWAKEKEMLRTLSDEYEVQIIGLRRYIDGDGRSESTPRTDRQDNHTGTEV